LKIVNNNKQHSGLKMSSVKIPHYSYINPCKAFPKRDNYTKKNTVSIKLE